MVVLCLVFFIKILYLAYTAYLAYTQTQPFPKELSLARSPGRILSRTSWTGATMSTWIWGPTGAGGAVGGHGDRLSPDIAIGELSAVSYFP